MIGRSASSIVKAAELGFHLATFDIKSRYQRSFLGPFWLTISSAVFVVAIGLAWAQLFGVSVEDQLPFVAVSYTAWVMFQGCLLEATGVFAASAMYVRDRGLDWLTFCFALFVRHITYLLHTIIVPTVALLLYQKSSWVGLLLAIPGIVVFLLIVMLTILPVGLIAARYRDTRSIIESGIVMLMLLTPVMWSPATLKPSAQALIDYNPLAQMLEIWRHPLLHGTINPWNYLVCLLLFTLLVWVNLKALQKLPRVIFWV
jgi:ABC-type polysaccharide/polyol phosphate export permease